jgi:hypothetical protein
MKTFYSFILLLLVSASAFSQPFYVYSATKSGIWNDATLWNISVRTDGVPKTKVIIPATFNVSVDNTVNSFGLGDVEINIFGSLSLQPATTIALSVISSVELFGAGKIIGINNTQKITIGGVTKYNGSLDLTKSGASIANSTTTVSPTGFRSTSLLPVKLISFTVNKANNDISLKWVTASEISYDYFEIERSYNGNTWTSVSKVKGTGSAASSSYYSYTDKNENGAVVYYRLKQVDLNGMAEYSIVKMIRGGKTSTAKIYATANTINIELNSEVKNPVVVTVMNSNGQVIEKKQFSAGYKISLNVNNKQAGIMLVNVADNNELNLTTKLFF